MNFLSGKYIVISSVILSVCSLTAAMYMYNRYQIVQDISSATKDSSGEIRTLLNEISVFMELPAGETPTLATVTDVTKLSTNPFFVHAKNGDKVLIFAKAAKAILYRPGTRKLIEVSVFNQQKFDSVTDTSATKMNKKLVVSILNGTKVSGATKQYSKNLEAKVNDITVMAADTAKRRDYSDTMIIDISKSHAARVAEIAKLLDIAVADLPDGETATGSDLLIIVGADALSQ